MLKLIDINKELKGKKVLSDINYEFTKGKIYLITGHNGCGKTMLLRLMAGLILPSKGQIKRDEDFNCGIIIENPMFMVNETAMYNLKFLAGINNKIGDKEILQALRDVNLFESRNELVKKFSLGMKQRLAIAQAIMENPNVLLLDEPFNALDKENLECVLKILQNEKSKNKIIIIAAHGFENADIIDESIELSSGKIIETKRL